MDVLIGEVYVVCVCGAVLDVQDGVAWVWRVWHYAWVCLCDEPAMMEYSACSGLANGYDSGIDSHETDACESVRRV